MRNCSTNARILDLGFYELLLTRTSKTLSPRQKILLKTRFLSMMSTLKFFEFREAASECLAAMGTWTQSAVTMPSRQDVPAPRAWSSGKLDHAGLHRLADSFSQRTFVASAKSPAYPKIRGITEAKRAARHANSRIARRSAISGLCSASGPGTAPATAEQSRCADRPTVAPTGLPLRRVAQPENLTLQDQPGSFCDPRQKPQQGRFTIKGFCAESANLRNAQLKTALQFLEFYWDKKRVRQACPHASSDATA